MPSSPAPPPRSATPPPASRRRLLSVESELTTPSSARESNAWQMLFLMGFTPPGRSAKKRGINMPDYACVAGVFCLNMSAPPEGIQDQWARTEDALLVIATES